MSYGDFSPQIRNKNEKKILKSQEILYKVPEQHSPIGLKTQGLWSYSSNSFAFKGPKQAWTPPVSVKD